MTTSTPVLRAKSVWATYSALSTPPLANTGSTPRTRRAGTISGGIDISNTFKDTTAAVGGKTAVLSFDIAKMDVNWDLHNYKTDPNASFEFRVDGKVVAQFDAADFTDFNSMKHFDIAIKGSDYNSGTDTHTLQLVDTTAPGPDNTSASRSTASRSTTGWSKYELRGGR